MKANIVLIPGDGIGPEIVREARKVLEHVAAKFGHEFCFTEIDMGGCSIDKYGEPLTTRTLRLRERVTRSCWERSAATSETPAGMISRRTSVLRRDF